MVIGCEVFRLSEAEQSLVEIRLNSGKKLMTERWRRFEVSVTATWDIGMRQNTLRQACPDSDIRSECLQGQAEHEVDHGTEYP